MKKSTILIISMVALATTLAFAYAYLRHKGRDEGKVKATETTPSPTPTNTPIPTATPTPNYSVYLSQFKAKLTTLNQELTQAKKEREEIQTFFDSARSRQSQLLVIKKNTTPSPISPVPNTGRDYDGEIKALQQKFDDFRNQASVLDQKITSIENEIKTNQGLIDKINAGTFTEADIPSAN